MENYNFVEAKGMERNGTFHPFHPYKSLFYKLSYLGTTALEDYQIMLERSQKIFLQPE